MCICKGKNKKLAGKKGAKPPNGETVKIVRRGGPQSPPPGSSEHMHGKKEKALLPVRRGGNYPRNLTKGELNGFQETGAKNKERKAETPRASEGGEKGGGKK